MGIRAAGLSIPLAAVSAWSQCDPAASLTPGDRVPLASGANPWQIDADDLDGDGNTDLVVSEPGARSVSVHLGNGDGTFRPAVRYDADDDIGVNPQGLAIADVTGDGIPDISAGAISSNSVTVLVGQGDGSFVSGGPFDAGSFVAPQDIAAADLENDGDIDLVVSSSANQVRVLLNNGDGTFAAPVFTFILGTIVSVELADINGDTIPDVVATDFTNNEIEYMFGDGFGAFGPFNSMDAPAGTSDIRVTDMNGDSDPDLIACGFFGEVAVYLSNGNGTFQPGVAYPATGVPRKLDVGDITVDGTPDVLVATGSTNPQTISLLQGGPGGTLGTESLFSGFNNANAVVIADFNNDGAPDAAAIFEASNDMQIYLNTCQAACPADLAPPAGVLNFFDISAFIAAFNAHDPAADFAAPFGVFNFFDVAEYIAAFNAGCP
ncbi:MAG: VCBS repeat-containing protein [Planctomycetota bacterium]